jgi:hypothetical protein
MRARTISIAALVMLTFLLGPVRAQRWGTPTPPNIPLAFGMTPDQVAQALGVDLLYVRGRPGYELLVALPNVKGATLAYRSDALYLQFRHGRLSGWKGDWGTIRP